MSTIQVEWALSTHGITKVELPTQNSNKPETVHFFFCSVKSIIVTPRGCSFFAKRQNQTNPINEISQANTSDFILKKLFCTFGRHRWLLTYYNPNQQVVYIHGSITNKWCYFFTQNGGGTWTSKERKRICNFNPFRKVFEACYVDRKVDLALLVKILKK